MEHSDYFRQKFGISYTTENSSWFMLFSFLLVVLVTILGKLYGNYLGLTNIGMLYLLPVVFASARLRVLQSIIVALASVLCLDIFFVPPILHLAVSDPRHLITFVTFMVVAYTTSNIASMLRHSMLDAFQREDQTRVLYELARGLSAVDDLELLARKVVSQVSETLGAEVALYLPDPNNKLVVAAASNAFSDLVLGTNDLLAAQWTYHNSQWSGLGTSTLTGAKGYHIPIKTEEKTLGVLGVKPLQSLFETEQLNLLEALAGLSALAIARLELAAEAQELNTLEASERLRSALFNSISHDLKTPLASIVGAVSSLVDEGDLYNEDQKATLLVSIKQGALRMNRLVNNLLDMARLESGYMQLNTDWSDIQDIIGVTLRENHEVLKEHNIKVDLPEKTRLIKVDYALIEQVLTNLLHNAVKYSPQQSEIELIASEEQDALLVSVSDRGVGIPNGDEERIFEKFYHLQYPGEVSGTGLGLSICRGIIEAHGGRIWAKNRFGGGSIFSFTLPIELTNLQSK